MSSETARRYFVAFIKTLESLLPYFPRYAIYVKDIRNMLRSIDEPNAPLPAQKASAEVDFRARRVSSEENSDEGNAEIQSPSTRANNDSRIPSNIEASGIGASPGLVDPQLQMPLPMDSQYPLFSDLNAPQYDIQFNADSDQGLLWDWAGALGFGFDV
jgi:hypothetical protein